jgi:hypothetical protein
MVSRGKVMPRWIRANGNAYGDDALRQRLLAGRALGLSADRRAAVFDHEVGLTTSQVRQHPTFDANDGCLGQLAAFRPNLTATSLLASLTSMARVDGSEWVAFLMFMCHGSGGRDRETAHGSGAVAHADFAAAFAKAGRSCPRLATVPLSTTTTALSA